MATDGHVVSPLIFPGGNMGCLGVHGVAVLSQRESLEFETTIESDTAALHPQVAAMLKAAPGAVRVLRDPTRGGLAQR